MRLSSLLNHVLLHRRALVCLAVGIAASVLFFSQASQSTATPQVAVQPAEARAIAKELLLWGMHPVALYHMRYNLTQNTQSHRYVGTNRLKLSRQPISAKVRGGTTPNASTLYGLAALDLAAEPVVITVPTISDRYWSIQMADNYSRWWHMIGSPFNAPGPVQRLLIGPNWHGKLPEEFSGAQIVQAPSDTSFAVLRVALTDDSPTEIKRINALQDRITLMPLSQWQAGGKKEVRAEDVPLVAGNYPAFAGMEQVTKPGTLKGLDFVRWASLVLNDPHYTKQADGYKEREAFKRFQKLGLKAGQPFDPATLSDELKAAIEAGVEDGYLAIQARIGQGLGADMGNGWSLSSDLDYHDSDWLMRAVYGYLAILGPVPSRSHTAAFTYKDSQGEKLDGTHRYTMTFNLDDLPPVDDFWEMPLYDREGYFVDNPINRYSLTSFMLQHRKLHTEDGKLVIYVQNEEPTDPQQKQNWLPAPKGGFQFAARFYGARGALIDGSYRMPAVVRVN